MAESSRRGVDQDGLVPENAPFDEEQRAWLNGFLAGLLGLSETEESASASGESGVSAAASPPHHRQQQRVRIAEGQVASARGDGLRAGRAEASVRGVERAVRPASSRPGPPSRVAVRSSRRLVQADEGVEIAEVVFDLQSGGLRYDVGDTLAVVPTNDLDLVRSLLRAMGARGQEVVPSRSGPREAWRCLLEDADVTHLGEDTLSLFAASASPSEARALSELSAKARADLDLLDLLERFPSARPSLERIVAALPPLTPRLYAIASSPSVHPMHAHVLVRALRRERGRRERKGVASTLLAEGVFKGDELAVHLAPMERMALQGDASMIFVAGGVGLGRFKGLLDELSHRGRRGGTWLVYVPSAGGEETLYEKEISAFRRSGVLEHLDVVSAPARGRRGGARELLRKRARRLSTWLSQGAHVYLSGEAHGAAPVLAEAIVDALCRHGRMSRPHAEGYLLSMRREGRYLEEVY